jgi:hypothetical protein
MLSKVYEWLRAADLKPDDAMVTSRTKVVEELEKKIREIKRKHIFAPVRPFNPVLATPGAIPE